MRRRRRSGARVLADGTPLRNRLLARLPDVDYRRIREHLRARVVDDGETLQEPGTRVRQIYFPNGGVFSMTTQLQNGGAVEVAIVGREGMLGLGVFFGDRIETGRTFQQIADGRLLSLPVGRFVEAIAAPGRFRDVIGLYAQANLLQAMQSTACNALHDVKQRCCRWLLQTHDRLDGDVFPLKHEFLAVMLGVHRPTVTVVMRSLQQKGLIASHYGRIRILKRKRLEAAACECYSVIKSHFARLGL